MKILVAGAGGFIGGHLVKSLLDEGHDLVCADLKPMEYWFQVFEKSNNFSLDLIYNDKNHQKENTECGVYCLHFLTNMLKGIGFKQYLKKPLSDKDIEKFRNIFFINKNNNITL